MADPIWWMKIQKVICFGWNSVLGGSSCRWLRIWIQNSRIENTGSNMAHQNAKVTCCGWNSVVVGFWGRWLRIRTHNFELQNGRSKTANQNAKNYLFVWNLIFGGLWHHCLRIWIQNARNSKWLLQYGGLKLWSDTWFG